MFTFRVLTTICFDDQPLPKRNKIQYPWPDRHLPTKFHICKAPRAK